MHDIFTGPEGWVHFGVIAWCELLYWITYPVWRPFTKQIDGFFEVEEW